MGILDTLIEAQDKVYEFGLKPEYKSKTEKKFKNAQVTHTYKEDKKSIEEICPWLST